MKNLILKLFVLFTAIIFTSCNGGGEQITNGTIGKNVFTLNYNVSGMNYMVFYTNDGDPFVVNVTKDSLYCFGKKSNEN